MSAAIKIRKWAFKHVEDELSAYYESKRDLIKMRNEILFIPTDGSVTALNNKKVEHLQSIIDAIETVYEKLPNEKQRLVNFAYWTKPQLRTWEGIAQTIPVGRKTAFRWRDEIVTSIAERLGWK